MWNWTYCFGIMHFINGERTVRAFILVSFLQTTVDQVRYSVPEEMRKGSFVGNVAEDLGVDAKRLKTGGARIVGSDSSEYIRLDVDKGILVVGERIDREQLCGQTSPCSLNFEMIMTSPMELHSVVVEVLDVNDNTPVFNEKEMHVEIVEAALPGTEILQVSATDPDVGINALQGYTLHPTTHFNIKVLSSPNGHKYAQLYLSGALDREKEEKLLLTLTAVDGGEPQRSGTLKVHVTVRDTNDNAPVFTQPIFKVSVKENVPKGTTVVRIIATDADEGIYGRVTYHLNRMSSNVAQLFHLDENSGDLTVYGVIDYEENKIFEISVLARDQGGQSTSTNVIIDVVDVNDNAPLITLTSFSNTIAEDSPSGTTVAIINVKDLDSGKNGKINLLINPDIPFEVHSSLKNYHTLVTKGVLDRERNPNYNITFTAVDEGNPPLSTNKTITLKVSDVNDNAPVFEQSFYEANIMENNSPGLSVFSVKARDADSGQNARVAYLLVDFQLNGQPISTYISVNAESGAVQAVRSFDYEQIKTLIIYMRGQDGGSPPLSSNTTVKLNILDQNDNPPQVLYPVQTGGSVVAEMVPRSADVGYLVTKVVAVDVDSGQNAWLSYKLQKSTDRALFEVGLQNGEIRTIRQVTDKDAVKQRLTVIVEDNGQPSRSATVIVNVAVADSFPEVLSEFTDFTHDKEYSDNLTFYLVLALAVVSFLFITCLVVIISVKIYRWRQSRILYHSNLPVIPYYPPRYSDTMGTGTLPHVYNYEVCRTTDSRKSDFKFGGAGSQNVLIMDPSSTGTMQRIQNEKSILDEPDSPLETTVGQVRYSVPEEMRKGSFVGNVAEDLGVDAKRLKTGGARIVGSDSSEYIRLDVDKGILVVGERIDREQLCGQTSPCSLNFEMIMTSPMELHSVVVEVLDVNDNTPVFNEKEMHVEILESALPGTEILQVSATDPDVGINALQEKRKKSCFSRSLLSMGVNHSDQTGGSVVAEMVPRSADVGYLVTKVVAVDVDSGQNAWLSYKLQKSTDRALFEVELQNGEIRTIRQVTDKDAVKQRLTVIVEDNGQPSRSATVIINVALADSFPEVLSEFTDFTHGKEYNDNLTFYLVLALAVVSFLFITCLVVIISVKIYRWRQSRILYHSNLPVIPYYPPRYSDTMGTGTLPHVYNYEVCRTTDSRKSDFNFVGDGSQKVLIMDPSCTGTMQRIQNDTSILDEPDSPLEDQNDNPPQVLYPVQTGGSVVAEMVPRSADVGYLVTKVVAVDVDSGQNAWLSYKLQKSTDRALFEVGLQNGEIRTIRQVTDKDAVKQRLTVIVEDNGQPSRSATVIVNVAVADSFPEVLSEFTDFTHDKEYNDNLTFYLVLALAVVSFLFITCLVVIISVKIYRWRQSRILYHSNLPVIPYYPPRYSDTLGTGTLPHVYNYEVCRTTDSRKSDYKFGGDGSQNVLIMDPSSTGTMQRIQNEKSILDEPDSPLEVRQFLSAPFFFI
ncbi:protocadherin beta-3-like [Melanotaenia boesemani]|uniref:protocadherin beta-3-like n=1 Tax=Melanotaenia boesemani TaxID=1250792 RepID=UPI001C05D339|nr:protocadherin beta-3-like [Melanotaenia boesemani]